MPGAVTYDLSGKAGYAIYEPGSDKPRYGIVTLPPSSTDGSNGHAFKLLFEHVAWVDRIVKGLDHIGYEAPMIATGGKKDDDKSFISNPKTTKRLVGTAAIMELCASILEVPCHSINNSSWRKMWLPGNPRGTERDEWKRQSVAKMNRLGWPPKGDDDADAMGQLHYLIEKLRRERVVDWKLPWQADLDKDLFKGGFYR